MLFRDEWNPLLNSCSNLAFNPSMRSPPSYSLCYSTIVDISNVIPLIYSRKRDLSSYIGRYNTKDAT